MLVATAGHIDHGKTSLIRALTGVETDRLPEERARGISIDLGFARWQAAPGVTIGFVDVPGHERFVRNMLAGLGAVELALLVIAADDGVMPQTREHLAILDLLGVARGVIVVTKTDRVPPERLEEVTERAHELLQGTSLAGSPVLALSAQTGEGLGDLADILREAAAQTPSRASLPRPFRLAIDRAFTISGAGSVVTGTVIDGAVATGDRLVLAPKGSEVRVRGLQSAGSAVARIEAGMRCAINLAGVELADLHRGTWLCSAQVAGATQRIVARLSLLASAAHPLRHNSLVHVHIGSGDFVARVLIIGGRTLVPGGSALVQLLFESPICCLTGDRTVIRDAGGQHTLGGARVVDPFAAIRSGRGKAGGQFVAALEAGSPERALRSLLEIADHETDLAHFARCFGLTDTEAQHLAGEAGAAVLGASRMLALASERVAAARSSMIAAVAAHHQDQPEAPGITPRALRSAMIPRLSATAFQALLKLQVSAGAVEMAGSHCRLPGHSPSFSAAELAMWQQVLAWAEERASEPFTLPDLITELRSSEAAVKALVHRRVQSGDLLRVTEKRLILRDQLANLTTHAEALDAASDGAGFSAAQYRDASGLGRNRVIEILEFLDGLGLTRRSGELRRVVR